MGNVCCGGGNYEQLQRQELLKEGCAFRKKTPYLGGVLSKSEHIYLQLNPSATRLLWRLTTGSSKAEEIPIYRVGKVCPNGSLELVIFGTSGSKLLELTAESAAVRDLWVQTLDEICFSVKPQTSDDDAKALQQELARQEDKQREKYWRDRTSELEQRKLDAEERKKKIGLAGMKYTAQAMAKR